MKTNRLSKISSLAFVLTLTAVLAPVTQSAPPNVLIIMPDDMSFDDYSYYNDQPDAPRTPNTDRLGGESLRLTDFHVAPTCSPSRSQLMTGRYTDACGAWHTVMGREFLRADEVTMADVFRANGYRTALFGKWHLGDTYPLRPKDRGFEHVVMIRGGGIDQQPNFWGDRNTTPSTIFVNDQPVELTESNGGLPGTSGAFATSFFTAQAMDYMKTCQARQEPFFAYVPYNVAHGPQDLPPDARAGVSARTATIENMDKNIGRLLTFLDDTGLADNTLLMFILGDNGEGSSILRAGKASHYEGGHRVPCFVRWPSGGYAGTTATAREMPRMVSEIDLLPTFLDLLNLHDVAHRPSQLVMAGRSIKTLLDSDPKNDDPAFGSRVLVVDNQRMDNLVKYKQASVMRDELDAAGQITHKWRAMRGSEDKPWELYDIEADMLQETNLLAQPSNGHIAEIAQSLQAAYEDWWRDVSVNAADYTRPIAGSPEEPVICLYSHDWHMEDLPPWNQTMIAEGLAANGFNAAAFAQAGDYTFDLRRWPREIAGETTLTSKLKSPIKSTSKNAPIFGKALPINSVRIRIWNGDKTYADERQDVTPDSDGAVFNVPLPAGPAMVQSWFYDSDGKELCGAYYDYVSLAKPAVSP